MQISNFCDCLSSIWKTKIRLRKWHYFANLTEIVSLISQDLCSDPKKPASIYLRNISMLHHINDDKKLQNLMHVARSIIFFTVFLGKWYMSVNETITCLRNEIEMSICC